MVVGAVRVDRLDLRMLRIATYRVTALGGSVFRAVISAIPFLLPVFLQLGFGWSAAKAGVVVSLFLGNIAVKPLTTPLMRRFGIRLVLLGAIDTSAPRRDGFPGGAHPLPLLVALLALSVTVRSIGFSAYNTSAFADVDSERITTANTFMSTLQELGAGLGVAVGALLVTLAVPSPTPSAWVTGPTERSASRSSCAASC